MAQHLTRNNTSPRRAAPVYSKVNGYKGTSFSAFDVGLPALREACRGYLAEAEPRIPFLATAISEDADGEGRGFAEWAKRLRCDAPSGNRHGDRPQTRRRRFAAGMLRDAHQHANGHALATASSRSCRRWCVTFELANSLGPGGND